MFRTEECRRQHLDNSEMRAGTIASYISQKKKKKVRGKRKLIQIKGNAEEIEVYFKVRRPTSGWGDFLSAFEICCRGPFEPHIFHYPNPVTRRYSVERSGDKSNMRRKKTAQKTLTLPIESILLCLAAKQDNCIHKTYV